MKIALITDTHWGVRNDNISFLDNNKLFLDKIFFPYIGENDINTIIHLGDIVDRRKFININTATRLRQDFLNPIDSRCIDLHIIAGNHDTYYKNTNEVNALRELIVGKYEYTYVYDEQPVEKIFDGLPILLIPWICDKNHKETIEAINATKAQIAMGHLEISGFQMYKGSPPSHGQESSVFSKFDMVMSGHYHHKSDNGHIFYLGSHAEFTWSDYDDPKGFHVFDTETRELTFIKNTYTMFEKVWYDDSKEIIENVGIDHLKNKIVKVIVSNKDNLYEFDRFVDKIQNIGVIDLQIVEDHLHLDLEGDETIVDEAEDTITIFRKHINNIDINEKQKQKIDTLMTKLYQEAISIE